MGKPLTLDEITALENRQHAGGISAMFTGPSAAQEAQAGAQMQRSVMSPAQGAEAAGGKVAEAVMGENPQIQSPVHTAATVAGALIGRSAPGRIVRFASGNLLRAGSPLWQAGMNAFGSAVGSALGGQVAKPTNETGPEAVSRLLWDGAMGAAGEYMTPAGRAIGGSKFAQALLGRRPNVVPSTVPLAREAQEVLTKRGATATLGQLLTSWPARTVENVLEVAIGGGAKYEATHHEATQAALSAWREALPAFGQKLSEKEMGAMTDGALNGSRDAQVAVGRAAYQKARTLARNMGVNDDVVFMDDVYHRFQNDKVLQNRLKAGDPMARSIKSTLENFILEEAPKVASKDMGVLAATSPPSALQAAGRTKNTMPVSFETAETMRSELLAISRSAQTEGIQGTASMAAPVAAWVDDAIELSAQQLGVPEVRAAYLGAREIWKKGVEQFNDPVIAEFIGKSRPEAIVQTLLQTGSPTRIDKLYKIIDNPEYAKAIGNPAQVKEGLQNAFLNEVWRKAIPKGSEDPLGKNILHQFKNSRGIFESFIPDPKKREGLKTIATAMELAQSKATSRTGSMLMQMKQGPAAAQMAGALFFGFQGLEAASVGTIVIPGGLASILNKKGVINYFLERNLNASANKGRAVGPVLGQYMARFIDKLRQDGVPFVHRAEDGQETVYDPTTQQAKGRYNPSPSQFKPQSKYQ